MSASSSTLPFLPIDPNSPAMATSDLLSQQFQGLAARKERSFQNFVQREAQRRAQEFQVGMSQMQAQQQAQAPIRQAQATLSGLPGLVAQGDALANQLILGAINSGNPELMKNAFKSLQQRGQKDLQEQRIKLEFAKQGKAPSGPGAPAGTTFDASTGAAFAPPTARPPGVYIGDVRAPDAPIEDGTFQFEPIEPFERQPSGVGVVTPERAAELMRMAGPGTPPAPRRETLDTQQAPGAAVNPLAGLFETSPSERMLQSPGMMLAMMALGGGNIGQMGQLQDAATRRRAFALLGSPEAADLTPQQRAILSGLTGVEAQTEFGANVAARGPQIRATEEALLQRLQASGAITVDPETKEISINVAYGIDMVPNLRIIEDAINKVYVSMRQFGASPADIHAGLSVIDTMLTRAANRTFGSRGEAEYIKRIRARLAELREQPVRQRGR